MRAAAAPAPRFAGVRRVLGWIACGPVTAAAAILTAAAVAVASSELGDGDLAYWVAAPVAVSLYVGRWLCPAPRFAVSLIALATLIALLVYAADTDESLAELLAGYVLGLAAAVAAATRRDAAARRAAVRTLRWTLCIPGGILAEAALVEVFDPDGGDLSPHTAAAAYVLIYGVSAMAAAFLAPAQRFRVLLVFAALTCLDAFIEPESTPPFAADFPNSLFGLLRQDLTVVATFALWALGTGIAALLVARFGVWMHGRALPDAHAEKLHRYKGTAPYQAEALDRQTFFGRERETRSLMSLVQAERLVVLFSKSGMGKSSLVNAGLVHPLLERGYVPLVVRLLKGNRSLAQTVIEGVRAAAAAAEVDIAGGEPDSLWRFFKTAEFWSKSDDLLQPVLILDQFEEIFTLHEKEDRQRLVEQLADLIRGPSGIDAETRARLGRDWADVRVVLAMREDFLAHLEELAGDIPAILHNRFRLGPLSREAATRAIVEPARLENEAFQTGSFEYAPAAVDRIIDFLSKHRNVEGARRRGDELQRGAGEVEPVQLQLICRYLEQSVRGRTRGDGESVRIEASDLGGDAQMGEVLEGFYDRIVDSVRPPRKARWVRRLCETRLISGGGRRLAEDAEIIEKDYKLTPALMRRLVDARLLRAESRAGSTLYELSHDRLVDPILRSRRRRTAQRVRTALFTIPLAVVIVWGVAATAIEHVDRVQDLAALQLELMDKDTRTAMLAARRLADEYGFDAEQLIAKIRDPSIVNPSVMLHWDLSLLEPDDQSAVYEHLDEFHDNFIRDFDDPRLAATFLGAVLVLIDDGVREDAPGYVRDFASDRREDVLARYRAKVASAGARETRCGGETRGDTAANVPRATAVTRAEYRCFNPLHPDPAAAQDVDRVVRVNWYEARAYAAFVGAALPTAEEVDALARDVRPAQWEELWLAEPAPPRDTDGSAPAAAADRSDGRRRYGLLSGPDAAHALGDPFAERPFTLIWRE